MALDITKHILVPVHTKVSDNEKEKFFSSMQITIAQLPKVHISDPAVSKLSVKAGDVVKIERKSPTAGVSFYYRVVIDG